MPFFSSSPTFVFHPPKAGEDRKLVQIEFTSDDGESVAAIALFTCREEAEKFIMSLHDEGSGMVISQLPPNMLADFLIALKHRRATHVSVNAQRGCSPLTIDEFIGGEEIDDFP